MKEIKYYVDSFNVKFLIEAVKFAPIQLEPDALRISIIDNRVLYFQSEEEVDEFCELLQEKKKEIWK